MQVLFTVADRCVPGSDCTLSKKDNWPDVPFDQICTDDESCEEQWSPTFFTRKRLKSVTTQVLDNDARVRAAERAIRQSAVIYPA